MTVRVLFFASLQELTGEGEKIVEVPDGATVEDLWVVLCSRYPLLGERRGTVSFAVNREYVASDCRLRPRDEVALIPPVSGG